MSKTYSKAHTSHSANSVVCNSLLFVDPIIHNFKLYLLWWSLYFALFYFFIHILMRNASCFSFEKWVVKNIVIIVIVIYFLHYWDNKRLAYWEWIMCLWCSIHTELDLGSIIVNIRIFCFLLWWYYPNNMWHTFTKNQSYILCLYVLLIKHKLPLELLWWDQRRHFVD